MYTSNPRQTIALLFLCLICLASAGKATAESETIATKNIEQKKPFSIQRVTLENAVASAEITPNIGGRLLHFGLKGYPNVVQTGAPVDKNQEPVISPFADNIGYLGHIVWIAPQAQWWQHQTLNQDRKNSKANWPPDPYLIFSNNTINTTTPRKLFLQGVASPISGIAVNKRFRLNESTAELSVVASAKNTSATALDWSLWFNTRVFPDTFIYAPVASADDVRIEQFSQDVNGPVEVELTNNILSIKLTPPPQGKAARQGKLFIQPSAGWMAGFRQGQLFVIEFTRNPKNAIHEGQAQLEFYVNISPGSSTAGLIEMELHTAKKTIVPKEEITAQEQWKLFKYSGGDSRENHLEILKNLYKQTSQKAP